MKKLLLSAVAVIIAMHSVLAQVNIYSQNFSTAGLPAGWQNVDASSVGGVAGKWQRKTSQYGFASTTSTNGFYMFISYAATNDNKPEDGQLITSAINCSQYANVALQFDHYFLTRYTNNNNSQGTVLVSTDNVTWTEVYAVNETTDADAQVRIDISQLAAYQPSVYIKFRYTGSWDGFWGVDDIKLFIPQVLDVAVTNITLDKYVGLADHTVTGTVSNEGAMVLSDFELTYQDGSNAPVTQQFTGLNIQPFATYNFSFNQKLTMATAEAHNITVTATSPNGGADGNVNNNSFSKLVTSLSGIPAKAVLIEEFTTAACQYCPDGTTVMNQILDANPHTVLGVGVHAGFGTDAMTTTDHSTLANQYTSGAPAAMIDRVLFKGEEEVGTNRGIWEDYALMQKEVSVPLAVSATTTYDANTRQLNVEASAKFYGPVKDSLRINAYIVEDSVSGSGSGYSQVNAYNTDNTSEWYQKGNPIVGFQHRHVGRQLFGGPWGSSNSIPEQTVDGDVFTQSYNRVLPATWDADQITVIVFVQKWSSNVNNRPIINAIEVGLNDTKSSEVIPSVYVPSTGIAEVQSNISQVSVYPNPTTDVLNIAYTVNNNTNVSFEVSSLIGETLTSFAPSAKANGAYRTQLNTSNFANGVYFVNVIENGKTVNTQKFVVNK